MLRSLASAARQASAVRSVSVARVAAAPRRWSSTEVSQADFDKNWEAYFNNESNDALMVRRGLNDLFAHDFVPNKAILEAAFRASRRVNDFPTSVRIFEGIKDKGGDEAYQFMLKELEPVIKELQLSTPEELGLA